MIVGKTVVVVFDLALVWFIWRTLARFGERVLIRKEAEKLVMQELQRQALREIRRDLRKPAKQTQAEYVRLNNESENRTEE